MGLTNSSTISSPLCAVCYKQLGSQWVQWKGGWAHPECVPASTVSPCRECQLRDERIDALRAENAELRQERDLMAEALYQANLPNCDDIPDEVCINCSCSMCAYALAEAAMEEEPDE
jgi:hypothetical protein